MYSELSNTLYKEIKFKVLNQDAHMPEKANQHEDSGFDLKSAERTVIKAGETKAIHTGLVLAIPQGYGGFILPRSGLAINYGIDVANSPGLIDSGYRGEVLVGLRNNGHTSFKINKGDRIAQIVFLETGQFYFDYDTTIDENETNRKDGGLGSTGV
jgi:dUTP pyrophosphatase